MFDWISPKTRLPAEGKPVRVIVVSDKVGEVETVAFRCHRTKSLWNPGEDCNLPEGVYYVKWWKEIETEKELLYKANTLRFVETFKQLLEDNHLSYTAFAREIGVRTTTVSDWTLGKHFPKISRLCKIADYFHVPVEALT